MQIISNHNDIESALSNKETEYALAMCIVQIGENVSKITDQIIQEKISAHKIIGLRNRIVHGYELFDRRIIADVLKIHIPELKVIISNILKKW